jgi:hypothetical protein
MTLALNPASEKYGKNFFKHEGIKFLINGQRGGKFGFVFPGFFNYGLYMFFEKFFMEQFRTG